MRKVRIVVFGALGRMGRAILDAMSTDPGFHLRSALIKERSEKKGATLDSQDLRTLGDIPTYVSLKKLRSPGDVIIDVTRAEAVADNITWAASAKIPYVLAVTGLNEATKAKVEKASKKIPIVVAPNLSVGIAVMNEVVRLIAQLLPESEIEMVETHHRAKKDAPSGTAIELARVMVESSSRKREVFFGRTNIGRGGDGDIFIHSLRAGDAVGEHQLKFFLEGEQIQVGHIATSRAIFARGALRAARFVVDQAPGIYTMRDVLGLGKIDHG